MKDILLVAGARPNFMKIAPLHAALTARGATVFLVHTGQHYDDAMSAVFFDELGIPKPDLNLGIGSGERIEQTRKIVQGLLPILAERTPELVVTVGDVTSTAAATLAAVVAGIPAAHVEAGLRSRNWRMPEELNRVIADHHGALLFASEPAGVANLREEGVAGKVHLVGNVMIDTLRRLEPRADASDVLDRLDLASGEHALLTMHRAENVDDPATLRALWGAIATVASRIPIVFPMHPRTKERVAAAGLTPPAGLRVTEPQSYVDTLALQKRARFVMTDSGGVQEETTVLGVPCITMRTETERPITVEEGTNDVVGLGPDAIVAAVDRVLAGQWKKGRVPELWDGHAAERIADIILAA